MAIVQISKVQIRRGRANNGTGVPQLASGELGWAVDSQELYIGNGSVSEGAPYVGNTLILTEHTNILDLALQYEYKRNTGLIQTGPSTSTPIQRTFQERLDDQVSVRSFGAIGDGVYNVADDTYTWSTDDTLALQRAVDELYLNDASEGVPASRVVLDLPAGIFIISNSIKIPPYATLHGAGKDKTIIVQTGNYPVFQTVGSTTDGITGYVDLLDMELINQSRGLSLTGMTLRTTTDVAPVLVLNATINSYFSNVKFQGSWQVGDTLVENNSGIELKAKSNIVTTADNEFNNCDFVNLSYAVYSTYDIRSNIFAECLIKLCGQGVSFGSNVNPAIEGRAVGPENNKFLDSRFVEVDQYGINIVAGNRNLSSRNSFVKVGNDGGSDSASAVYPVIYFGNGSNSSVNDSFERSYNLTSNLSFINNRYISEVAGIASSDHRFNTQINLSPNAINSTLLRLPGNESSRIKLHYIYRSLSNSVVRQGTMYVTVDKFNNEVKLTDEYDVTGNQLKINALSFSASLLDLAVPPSEVGDNDKETVFIKYTNDTASENGYFNYWYEILS